MGKSNKPSWDKAPKWANWLACDGNGGCFWYWFEEEPMKSGSVDYTWTNHITTKFDNSGHCAPEDWAEANWDTSVEAKPGLPHSASTAEADKYKKVGPSRHKRVTLFIDYDGEIDDDEKLSYIVAGILKSRLNDDAMQIDHSTVDRIRIAVNVNKTNEINYDPDECEFFIDGEEPTHDDDDDDDDAGF